MTKFRFSKPEKQLIYRKPTGKKLKIETAEKPDLLRHEFPYIEVPRITFDGKIVPMDLPEEFFITDTTFRDGQQARPPYTVKQIVDLYTLTHRLGGPKGVIRKSEFFLYSKKDKEAVRNCLKLGFKYPKVTGWIRAHPKDLQIVKEMGLNETGILTSISDYHIYLKLGWNRERAVRSYLNIVREAIKAEILPRCHLEDLTRSDVYGVVVPFAQRLMEVAKETGMPIIIRLCDTMGYGVSYPEAALPRSIPKLINVLINEAGVPKEQLEWHGHNDFGKVHTNAATAWLYGCAYANGTLLGFGERTGNPPIEQLCIEYVGLTGKTNGIDLSIITDIGNYYREKLRNVVPPNFPFVGESFNVTRAGIHADGTIKNEEIYNIFDTKEILKRPIGVTITDKSGLAGIALWANSCLGKRVISKDHPGVKKIHEWVQKQYEMGRTTGISPEEMLKLSNKYLKKHFKDRKTCILW